MEFNSHEINCQCNECVNFRNIPSQHFLSSTVFNNDEQFQEYPQIDAILFNAQSNYEEELATTTSYQTQTQTETMSTFSTTNYPNYYQSSAAANYEQFPSNLSTTSCSQQQQQSEVVFEDFNLPSTSAAGTSGGGSAKTSHQTAVRTKKNKSRKVCSHCQKVFNHTGDYRKHLRKHTKEKPFNCRSCDKRFSHSSNLHRHERSHSGKRPFKCDVCFKEFNRKDKLISHKKSKTCKKKSENCDNKK